MSTDRWPTEPAADVAGIDAASGRGLALVDEPIDEDLEEIEQGARSRRAPFVMGGVTAAAGLTAWSCAQIAAAFGGADAAATTAAVTVAGTAVAVPVLRSVFRNRIPDAWRRRWWLSTSCAAAWVDVVAAQGPGLLAFDTAVGLASVLLLGGVALGARWADEHEVPNPGDVEGEPGPAPAPLVAAPRRPQIETGRAVEIERDWVAEVAGGRNPIAPRAVLQRRTHLPHGYRWIVQLDRGGSVGCTDLETEGMAARVALKLGVRATHVMLERLDGDDDREDQAQLTVVTRDALADGVHYEGPDYRDGVIRIGRRADGTGNAPWHTYNDTGVQSGVVTGGQRSGKSSLLALLGMGYRSSGEWIVLFGDGDVMGRSSPLLGQVAHDFARGPAEVLQQLEGLEALRGVRGPLMGTLTEGSDGRPVPIARPGQKPADKLMPCPSLPGIVWILDEFHLLSGDADLQAVNFVPRVGRVVRLLAKYGVSLIIGTHSALGDDWDGDSALRGMASQANNVSLRNNNKSEQGIITNGGFSPNMLPSGGGYAYSSAGGDTAMIRIAYSRTMADYLPDVLACGVPDRRSWDAFLRYRTVQQLDPVANYHESTAQLEAFDRAIATGAPLPGSPQEQAALATDGDGSTDMSMAIGGFTVPAAVGGNVVPIRADVGERPRDASGAPGRVSEKALRVLAILKTHPEPWTTAQLAHATGLSKPDVSKALRELVEAGRAHRPTGKQGLYAAGPAPATGP